MHMLRWGRRGTGRRQGPLLSVVLRIDRGTCLDGDIDTYLLGKYLCRYLGTREGMLLRQRVSSVNEAPSRWRSAPVPTTTTTRDLL
jgi:hypothetical protein